ncbi:MAG: cyclic nucleotide-binding domain-containing protein [Anaerolineaceae bacterium]
MPEINAHLQQILKDIFPFSDLDTININLLSPCLERVHFQAGNKIFSCGEAAEYIYFIHSGKVEVSLQAKETLQTLQRLIAYDHFGEDAIFNNVYQTQALAKTSVNLIRISKKNLEYVCTKSPMISRIFQIFASTYKISCRKQFDWRQPSETLYLVSRHHVFFLLVKLFPIILVSLGVFAWLFYTSFTSQLNSILWIVLALIALAFGSLFCVWEYLAWSNEYFALTKDRILEQKLLIGLFESRQETPLTAILSVGMNTSFLGRLIGYGVVTARSYTGNLTIPRIPNSDLVLLYLEYRRKCIMADQQRQEKESMHAMLDNRLHPEHTASRPSPSLENEKPVPVNYYSNSFSDLLARLFMLRREKDGAVIYHTHWWILLKKLLLPSLLLLFVVVTSLARFFDLISVDAVLVYSLALILAVVGWCWWFYQYIDWRNDVYIITSDQLVDMNQRPLGTQDKKSAPIKNIQTVEYQRNGIIGMALNYGTVKIQIGNEELTFDNVYNPSVIQTEIFNRFREFNEHARKMEQKRMTDWFSTYDGIRDDPENGH